MLGPFTAVAKAGVPSGPPLRESEGLMVSRGKASSLSAERVSSPFPFVGFGESFLFLGFCRVMNGGLLFPTSAKQSSLYLFGDDGFPFSLFK